MQCGPLRIPGPGRGFQESAPAQHLRAVQKQGQRKAGSVMLEHAVGQGGDDDLVGDSFNSNMRSTSMAVSVTRCRPPPRISAWLRRRWPGRRAAALRSCRVMPWPLRRITRAAAGQAGVRGTAPLGQQHADETAPYRKQGRELCQLGLARGDGGCRVSLRRRSRLMKKGPPCPGGPPGEGLLGGQPGLYEGTDQQADGETEHEITARMGSGPGTPGCVTRRTLRARRSRRSRLRG